MWFPSSSKTRVIVKLKKKDEFISNGLVIVVKQLSFLLHKDAKVNEVEVLHIYLVQQGYIVILFLVAMLQNLSVIYHQCNHQWGESFTLHQQKASLMFANAEMANADDSHTAPETKYGSPASCPTRSYPPLISGAMGQLWWSAAPCSTQNMRMAMSANQLLTDWW